MKTRLAVATRAIRRSAISLLLPAAFASSVCAQPEAGGRLVFEGYSLLPPPGSGWRIVSRDRWGVVFGEESSSVRHSLAALAATHRGFDPASVGFATYAKDPQVFAAYVKAATANANPPGGRTRILEHEVVADSRFGYCAREHVRFEDRSSSLTVRKLILEDWAYSCLRPDDPTILVQIVFSERGLPGKSDPAVAEVRERFFSGFALTASPVPAASAPAPRPAVSDTRAVPGVAAAAPSTQSDEFADALAAFDRRDYPKSHDALFALAERGNARAELMVVADFSVGWGVACSLPQSMVWGHRALGDARRSDFEFLIGHWSALAEAGDALAQAWMAMMFNSEFGVAMDEGAAFRWAKRSADQGNPRGQHYLGMLYGNGQGTAKDERKALAYFELAAQQGDAAALGDIGNAHLFGRGVRRDSATAATWYRKAADRGDASAAYNLAYLYDQGKGVRRDPTQALAWYGKAAASGSVLALNNLAFLYLKGEGVERDPMRAYQFSTLAASKLPLVQESGQRDAISRVWALTEGALDPAQRREALFRLGERCRDGDGVPRDDLQAYRWMSRAIAGEQDESRRKARIARRDQLTERMHPEAVSRAQLCDARPVEEVEDWTCE